MEIGWYLRFAKTDMIEALVTHKTLEQVRHEIHTFPDWDFSFEPCDGNVVAKMVRKKPVYNKDMT